MLDLPGIEYRINGPKLPQELQPGTVIQLGNHACEFNTNFNAWNSLEPGMTAILQDGGIEARVERINNATASLTITKGDTIRPNTHLNFPALKPAPDGLSDQDKQFIQFAVHHHFDQIALSHIRHPDQVSAALRYLDSIADSTRPMMVVKIENRDAVKHMEAIIELADVLLLGRGDLSTEMAPWEIPVAQRKLISRCRNKSKPVYIATKVLPSLASSETPSRAEVSDLASAVLDGVTGITLTDETVLTGDPAKAVKWCRTIIDGVIKATNAEELSQRYDQIELAATLKKLAEIGPLIWQRGWAEANAGNVSVRLTKPANGADIFLVSRTGSRYRQMAMEPMNSLLLVEASGTEWHSLVPRAKPTSEWMAHLLLHRHFDTLESPNRVVLHCHPAPVIAISHYPVFKSPDVLNQELAAVLPELPLYLPLGLSCCPAEAPGSIELAIASADCLGPRNALIWEKHGLLCFAPTLDQAFDYIEIIVKAAELWLKIKAPSSR